MRRLLSTLLLAASLLVAPLLDASAASAQDVDMGGEAAMLERINALRAEQQLAPLSRADELDAVARAHSAEMASNGALTHVSQRTGTPEDRVRGTGLPASTVAENVALHRDASQAHEALLGSAPHRQNMLSPDVTHVGLGAIQTAQGVYVTQVFAGLPDAAPVVAPNAPVEAAPDAPEAEGGSIFQIIPPFVEEAAQQASEIAAPVLAPVTQAAAPVLDPAAETAELPGMEPISPFEIEGTDESAAVAEAPAVEAPLDAPVEAPAEAPAGTSPQVQVSPAAAATLRQLVGLGLALLGNAAATPAQ